METEGPGRLRVRRGGKGSIEILRNGEREVEGEERETETGRKGKKVEKSYRYYCLH